MESVINKAIEWFKAISEATKELTSGNVSHKACAIRGIANRSAEYLEKHKGSLFVLKWSTGEPSSTGSYLVSIGDRFVTVDYYCCLKGRWSYWNVEVTAWCKLSDIEPYKEKQE